MFKKILGSLSKNLGIDMGTANTLVYVQDKGIVINEPSVVALNTKTDEIIAVGQEAKRMMGKTPTYIYACKPLQDGVVSDFEVAEKMLKHFIEKVHRETFSIIPRPLVIIAIPLNITEVERKAVADAALYAGAREVYLIEEPMASAIGARIPIQDSTGHMIVDSGGGTTGIAVISLGGIVTWRSLRLGGDELNKNIINYVRDHFNLLLGDKTAEEVKIALGSASIDDEVIENHVRGRDLLTGLPREITVTSQHLREAMERSLHTIIDNIKQVLEITPPELVADIYERGIVLSGGTSLLRGLDRRISKEIHIPVSIVDDPLTAVVRGTGFMLEDINQLKHLFISAQDSIE